MIGYFIHGPFKCIANKTINSTFFKTKDNEVCNRKNNFINHPCRYNTFCIVFSPPKNFAIFVRWKSFNKFRQKKIKNQQNAHQLKYKILLSFPQEPLGFMKRTISFFQSPQTCLLLSSLTHIHKIPTKTQSLLETVLTPLRSVFESLF